MVASRGTRRFGLMRPSRRPISPETRPAQRIGRSIMDVGFIGLGGMGKAMAANLVKAGHRVRVWNRSPGPVKELVALGAEAVAAPRDLARSEVVITMLADDAATRSVVLEGGLLEAAAPGLIHVNMATVSVAFAQELAELHRRRGIAYVAAPVFGRVEIAAAGKLNIVAAGEHAALARVEPLFAVLGQKVWPLGEAPERANVVKIAGNFMLASAIETMGEAVALVGGYGVGPSELLDILTNTLFAAPAYKTYGALIAEERYEPAGFKLTLGLKDVRLALTAGEAAHVPLPFASVLRDNFLDAIAAGDAERDWAALARVARRRAGLS
jgi:3-hydroxyisobutyrate dehydrogenase-like beta-hydroxyacid dehydrogenase